MNRYGKIFELEVGNTKIFFIDGEKKILIDTGLMALPDEVIDFFEKTGMKIDRDRKEMLRSGAYASIVNYLNGNSVKPEMIVCTHCHLDHAGNLNSLRSLYDVPVAVHALDKPIVEGRDRLPSPSFIPAHLLKFFEYEPCPVDLSLEDGDLIARDLRVIHTPGHTPGNICLLYQDEVLIAGDSLSGRNEEAPETASNDLNPPSPAVSIDHKEALDSLRKLLSFEFDSILPSHGTSIRMDGKELLKKMIWSLP
jgi:glyoxylase-like metal-dependent hydrolase (beta-lactamase superfamily II)